jgi:putative FmdB family regulatory protein
VPTYQYACTECGDRVEVVQRFSDDPLTVCAACGGKLRKVFSPVGIVFKGSGFYRTDSRTSSVSGSSANGKAGGESSPGTDSAKKDDAGAKASSDSSSSTASSSGGEGAKSAAAAGSGTSSKVA